MNFNCRNNGQFYLEDWKKTINLHERHRNKNTKERKLRAMRCELRMRLMVCNAQFKPVAKDFRNS